MQRFDIVVIGAGGAAEAAVHLATSRGASVAVIDRELFGGSCPYWACMPGGDGHAARSGEAGAPTDHRVTSDGAETELEAGAVIVAVGSHSRIPDLPGLEDIEPWTNRQGTSTRELPKSLVVPGAGPTGVELSQVYARYGVRVILVHPSERINDKDHPKSSEVVAAALAADGVTMRLNVRAERIAARAGADGAHVVHLSDGSTVEGHEILLAIGRDFPVEELNLGAIGAEPSDGRLEVDDQLRLAKDVYVAGDVAGPEMHTHLAHYQGEMAARLALGDDVRPDHTAIPRAIYTDPESASVGLRLEEARERGIDAAEFSVDLAKTAKGYTAEAKGHATIIVDRRAGTVVATPMASGYQVDRPPR